MTTTTTTTTTEITVKLNGKVFLTVFAVLTVLYVVPWGNPVQSLSWWMILLPLMMYVAQRVVGKLIFLAARSAIQAKQRGLRP